MKTNISNFWLGVFVGLLIMWIGCVIVLLSMPSAMDVYQREYGIAIHHTGRKDNRLLRSLER